MPDARVVSCPQSRGFCLRGEGRNRERETVGKNGRVTEIRERGGEVKKDKERSDADRKNRQNEREKRRLIEKCIKYIAQIDG